ncbi:MAG: D-sedoheptulose 7-phosphate isomerase [Candidatus Omnitrophica bacterium]|nr:D-sedoheptulose 7-phosphate isomerase [Candidatus Omnitrophota bacterium]
MEENITKAINKHKEALEILQKQSLTVAKIASLLIESLEAGGKIIFIGNGGSAADAQHLAAELVGRFRKNRKALAAIALTTDTSILTAIGNDFGFDQIFSRQIEALAKNKDIIVGISTSGKSKNIIKAIEVAKELGLKSIGFLGKDGGDIKSLVDVNLTISLDNTPSIQEMHILAGHAICEIVENHFSNTECDG